MLLQAIGSAMVIATAALPSTLASSGDHGAALLLSGTAVCGAARSKRPTRGRIGFTGEEQFQAMRALVRVELNRMTRDGEKHSHSAPSPPRSVTAVNGLPSRPGADLGDRPPALLAAPPARGLRRIRRALHDRVRPEHGGLPGRAGESSTEQRPWHSRGRVARGGEETDAAGRRRRQAADS